MNSRSAFCALKALKERCDSYIREMDSHFEDLEDWKELLRSDVRELLKGKGNMKRPVIAKNPTSSSKMKTNHLDIIQESVSDGECDDGTVQNLSKVLPPYVSSCVSPLPSDVEEQNSVKSYEKLQNSKGSILKRIVTDSLQNVNLQCSSKIFVSNLEEQKSSRNNCRKLQSINKVAVTSVNGSNRDNSTSTKRSLSHKSHCVEKKLSLFHTNKKECSEQRIVQLVSSDTNVLLESAKNINKFVSSTGSGISIMKNLINTAEDSGKSKDFKKQTEDIDKTLSNGDLLSTELECVRAEEFFTKGQISPNTGNTMVLDRLKTYKRKSTDKVTLAYQPKNAEQEEVFGTRSSQRLFDNDGNKSKISGSRRIAKELVHSKNVQGLATNELYSSENKENRKEIENKNCRGGEDEIKVLNDARSIQNKQNSVTDYNVFYGEPENSHDKEKLNDPHDELEEQEMINVVNNKSVTTTYTPIIVEPDTSRKESIILLSSGLKKADSFLGNNDSAVKENGNEINGDLCFLSCPVEQIGNGDSLKNNPINPCSLGPFKAVSVETSCKLTSEIVSKFSHAVKTKKRSFEEFEKSLLFKRSCLMQENLIQAGVNVSTTVKTTDQFEMRRSFNREEKCESQRITCLIQGNEIESKKFMINLRNHSIIMQQNDPNIEGLKCNLNSEHEKFSLNYYEESGGKDKSLERDAASENQQVKKKEHCNKLIKKADAEIVRSTKRVTRSKSRALNTAGNLGAVNLDMKIGQDMIANKEWCRKSINKAIKTLLIADKKTQADKELKNSSKNTPFARPFINFGSATQVAKSAKKPNIITNVETFIKKPTKGIDLVEKKLEGIKKREEKENDALRRKEEMLRKRAEEQKRRKEERRMKVIHNREAREKEKKEIHVRVANEKSEKLNTLLQKREMNRKGNVVTKKLETDEKVANADEKIEDTTNVAKMLQELIIQKTVLEETEKEAQKYDVKEKISSVLWEKMEQKDKEMGLLEQNNVLQKNADKCNSTAVLNTTWIKPTSSVNTKAVNSSDTETLSNAYFLDDLLSEDSDKEDEKCHPKKTARWAKKARLLLESRWQLLLRSRANKMFSFNKTIDIFPNKRLMRTSSAKWDTPLRWSILPKY